MIIEQKNDRNQVDGFWESLGWAILIFCMMSLMWAAIEYLNAVTGYPLAAYPFGSFIMVGILGGIIYWIATNFTFYRKDNCVLCNERHYVWEMWQIAGTSYRKQFHPVYICKTHKSWREAR